MDWVTGREIPEDEPIHFDHIHPYARGGESELNNIATVSQETNLKKGRLTLLEYKTKLRMDRFFETGDRLTMGDLLRHLKRLGEIEAFGEPLRVITDNGKVEIQTDDLRSQSFEVQTCPITGWRYFYATLPVSVLDSDDDTDTSHGLQPRYLIIEKTFNLYRHFLNHPVLQPSIGRMVGQKIRLFDGQHKIAGLLFGGRKEFECKVYVDAELRLLNQTNIDAHDAFAQTRFFSSVMVMKLGSQFGRDFDEFKADSAVTVKSEAAFMDWLRSKDNESTTGELNKRFRAFLYNSVLQEPTNKLSALVSAGNRGSGKTPLTVDQLEKSLFSEFLFRAPVDHDMTTDRWQRDVEIENVVFLMNTLYETALHAWDPEVGKNDQTQLALERMIRSKSMMAWSEILRDAICAKLDMHDADQRAMPFYRTFTDEQRERMAKIIRRLTEWRQWIAAPDSEIDRRMSDNESQVRQWFRDHGLTTGYLMGAQE